MTYVTKAIMEAIEQSFAAGNLRPKFREIGALAFYETESARLTPIMERMMFGAMKGMVERLQEMGVLVVPANQFLYDNWGKDEEPDSMREAYLCLPRAGKPAVGIVKTTPQSFIYKTWRGSSYLRAVATWETQQSRIARDIKYGWLTNAEVDQLKRNPEEFRRLLN